jgi:3-methyl-2-oxobutanoate hydroxymethyltransferase
LLLLEAVPPELGQFITNLLPIPVYGIGAGMYTDGQLIIVSDVIGQFQAFTPKFVKKYANVSEVVTQAIRSYGDEVRSGQFPAEEHCYRMVEGEHEKFRELVENYGG